jgi:uncharacterized membrane protein
VLEWIRLGLGILAAGLAGLGLVFWIAANWSSLSTLMQFALLQALVLVLFGGTAFLPGARVPFSLLGFIATGALFAFFGQTYQTGADPWLLFASWAVLGLPLAMVAKADSVWSAWTVVALTGVALWDYANAGYSWRYEADTEWAHMLAACTALLVTWALRPASSRVYGNGPWAFGFALVLTSIFITEKALTSLLHWPNAFYVGSLGLFGAAAVMVATPRMFDVFAASVIGLALNTLLIGGLVDMLSSRSDSLLGSLLLVALAAAALLGITVRTIMRLAQRQAAKGPAA